MLKMSTHVPNSVLEPRPAHHSNTVTQEQNAKSLTHCTPTGRRRVGRGSEAQHRVLIDMQTRGVSPNPNPHTALTSRLTQSRERSLSYSGSLLSHDKILQVPPTLPFTLCPQKSQQKSQPSVTFEGPLPPHHTPSHPRRASGWDQQSDQEGQVGQPTLQRPEQRPTSMLISSLLSMWCT